MERSEVIIIGAGIGGLAAALGLQRAGVQVRIYEQAPALGEVGAGLSISPNGALGLKSLGVFDEFRNVAFAADEQCVRHFQTGRVLAKVERGDRLEDAYGERYYVVHRADLHRVLSDAVLSWPLMKPGCRQALLILQRPQRAGKAAIWSLWRWPRRTRHSSCLPLAPRGVPRRRCLTSARC